MTLSQTIARLISPVPLIVFLATPIHASYQDSIGLNDLRSRDATLTGDGIAVSQVEAEDGAGDWQTDPANVGLSESIFRYYNTTSPYPAGASYDSSLESNHANIVGGRYFADPSGTDGRDGIAPGVESIGVFNATYFYNLLIATGTDVNIPIVNQSFVFNSLNALIDSAYDDYADNYGVLFLNGLNTTQNPATIPSPASSFNGIAVGVVDDNLTPLADGRSKPDIVAPGSTAASYTTPLVAGAAAILRQSGLRDDGGIGTASDATDPRTLKALLLNAATKPDGWSNSETRPLDPVNGAGILQIDHSQILLAAGQFSETSDDIQTTPGSAHLPPASEDNVGSLRGWNFSTLTNERQFGVFQDATDHYFFDCDESIASTFHLTATLVWHRQAGENDINNLDLFLYHEDGTLIASSISIVDNVEHLYELDLPAGRYVLQVHKNAGTFVSASESYALAFDFALAAPAAASAPTASALSDDSIQLHWIDNASNETGFRIERRLSGEPSYSTLTTTAANISSYLDTGLDSETTYEYRIIASNDEGDANPAETSVTTLSLLENWRLENFGTYDGTDDSANAADPDDDNVPNLVEFMIGTDPTTPSPQPIDPQHLASSGEVNFLWRTNTDFDFSIGLSVDLRAGFTSYDSITLDSGGSPEIELVSVSPVNEEFEDRSYRVRDSVISEMLFLRLEIHSP